MLFTLLIPKVEFQSTLPARGATPASDRAQPGERRFQSTLPARGATNPRRNHARQQIYFNPRSPHGERRTAGRAPEKEGTFQSTLPARGATLHEAPRAQRRRISIHAPRTGSDGDFVAQCPQREDISIHAPRTGSDGFRRAMPAARGYFNPRSPHGERRLSKRRRKSAQAFQSTLPARGATPWASAARGRSRISIHAPRTGSDSPAPAALRPSPYFNPRSPHGERLSSSVGPRSQM